MHVAVADLASIVLAERRRKLDVDASASAALDAAADLIDEVLAEAGVRSEQVVAAGMGVPGPIALPSGRVGSSSILPGWEGLDPTRALAARLRDVHVQALNDADLGALAESSRGADEAIDHLVYLKISTGIGAVLVLSNRLHRGIAGGAGEIGHVRVRADGIACRSGNRGCLETVAAAPAVLAALRPVHGDRLELDGVLELARRGDHATTRVPRDAGRAVGRVLGDMCNVLNPRAFVVGGDLSAAGAPLIEGIGSRSTATRNPKPRSRSRCVGARSARGRRCSAPWRS